MKQIKIPETVENIENSAFYCCSSLRNINLPDGIKTIESKTFYGCESLETVQIPSSVKTIGESAFYNCSQLKEIDFGKGLLEIGEEAFDSCHSLEKIDLPQSLKLIKHRAFSSFNDKKYVTFSGAIPPKIEKDAFLLCSSISITVPSDSFQRYIDEYAEGDPFQYCSSWKLPKNRIHKEKVDDEKPQTQEKDISKNKKGFLGKLFG